MLQGQIHIFDDLLLPCHHVEQLIGHGVGVAVEQTDPARALDRAELRQKLRQGITAVKILSVARGILRDKDQLLRALGGSASATMLSIVRLR